MIEFCKIIAVIFFLLNVQQIFSSVRGDAEGRSPEEVINLSRILGAAVRPKGIVSPAIKAAIETSKSAVFIIADGKNATGVLLDEWTVLTCAHDIADASNVNVLNLGTYGKNLSDASFAVSVKKVIVFPSFTKLKAQNYSVSSNSCGEHILVNNSGELCSFSALPGLDYDQLLATIPWGNFGGIDLAILKLSKPLSITRYPVLSPTRANGYGLAVGYGIQSVNTPEGAVGLTDQFYSRHAISCEVTCQDVSRSVVYASYFGKVGHGDESFIPNADMKKTAGLPVSGDSGGPLFIQNENEYCLAGIYSRTFAPISRVVHSLQSLGVVQPLFPTWTDLSLPIIQQWIRGNMGEYT